MSDIIERLEKADRLIVDRLDMSGDCWLWTGKVDERGRGRVWRNGKLRLHHRAIWEILVGEIPDDALLCHHCDNPRCANPAHLYVGDAKSNAADMARRKRTWAHRDPDLAKRTGARLGGSNDWSKGARNPKARLSPSQVEQIKTQHGSSYAVAKQFGVDASTVQRIRRGATWN